MKFRGSFEIRKEKAPSCEEYFVLKARNGKTLFKSESYSSRQALMKGIRSVRTHALIAKVIVREEE